MDLFDFNHDGEVSDLERIMGLAAVLSEANPDVEISVTVDEDENYESMTHDELEDCLDELRTQRDTLECEEPDDLDSEAYEEWEEQCEQLDEKIEEIDTAGMVRLKLLAVWFSYCYFSLPCLLLASIF